MCIFLHWMYPGCKSILRIQLDFFQGDLRIHQKTLYQFLWHFLFLIRFSIRKLFLIIPNSLADVSMHLPLIRQQTAVSLSLTAEIMPGSIFSPLFKQAMGCRCMKVADSKTDTESEKSDNSSKTKDFITRNGKKRDLVSCLPLKQVNDVIQCIQITNLDNSEGNWMTTYIETVKK